MITFLLTFIYIIVCLVLIAVVLLQTGKRADLAGAFGGGGSQTAFGARGAATFLSRLTTWCAIIFMVTAMLLAILKSSSGPGHGSVLDTSPVPAGATTPAPKVPPRSAPTQRQGQGQKSNQGQAPAPAPPSSDAPPSPAPSGGQPPAPEGK